jgi:hypothetical protein
MSQPPNSVALPHMYTYSPGLVSAYTEKSIGIVVVILVGYIGIDFGVFIIFYYGGH